jgi:3-deoxy-D-manno-octulosonic-acid transferase
MLRPARAYRLAVAILRPLIPLAARVNSKLARAHAGRRESAVRFQAWGASHRDPSRPLALVHAASAGELRQAEPVLRRLRMARPSWQFAVTCFSPSGEAVAAGLPADVSGLLPWDRPDEVRALFSALRPGIVVVSRLDLWPELAFEARRRGAALALIAATLRPRSGRLQWPAHSILAPAYALVDRAAAVSQADSVLLQRLGVPPARITVEGDPRYDGVLERVADAAPVPDQAPRLVAGSTWRPDEVVLLQAFAAVRARRPEARLVLAPHEPTPGALARLARMARQLNLPSPVPVDAPAGAEAPLKVLEAVGGLAPLYGTGTVAYVGGGFAQAGLHSVLEPAALGIPVIVGPHWQENRDAAVLQQAGALVGLEAADPVDSLVRQWLAWLEHGDARRLAGAAARQAVLAGAGAADRCTALLLELVESTQGRE